MIRRFFQWLFGRKAAPGPGSVVLGIKQRAARGSEMCSRCMLGTCKGHQVIAVQWSDGGETYTCGWCWRMLTEVYEPEIDADAEIEGDAEEIYG